MIIIPGQSGTYRHVRRCVTDLLAESGQSRSCDRVCHRAMRATRTALRPRGNRRDPGTPREYWWDRVDEWPDAGRGGEPEITVFVRSLHEYLRTAAHTRPSIPVIRPQRPGQSGNERDSQGGERPVGEPRVGHPGLPAPGARADRPLPRAVTPGEGTAP